MALEGAEVPVVIPKDTPLIERSSDTARDFIGVYLEKFRNSSTPDEPKLTPEMYTSGEAYAGHRKREAAYYQDLWGKFFIGKIESTAISDEVKDMYRLFVAQDMMKPEADEMKAEYTDRPEPGMPPKPMPKKLSPREQIMGNAAVDQLNIFLAASELEKLIDLNRYAKMLEEDPEGLLTDLP